MTNSTNTLNLNNETKEERIIRWQAEEIDNYRHESVRTVKMMVEAMKNLVGTEESQYCNKVESNGEYDCWRCEVLEAIEDIENALKDPALMQAGN